MHWPNDCKQNNNNKIKNKNKKTQQPTAHEQKHKINTRMGEANGAIEFNEMFS